MGATLGISRCLCGHVGDVSSRPEMQGTGMPVLHVGMLGHGRCLASGCKCKAFTWKEYLPSTPPEEDCTVCGGPNCACEDENGVMP